MYFVKISLLPGPKFICVSSTECMLLPWLLDFILEEAYSYLTVEWGNVVRHFDAFLGVLTTDGAKGIT